MLLQIPEVLDAAQVAQARALLARAQWVDGRVTAGHQSARVKDNLQIPEGSAEHRALGDLVLAALERNALFITAVLPQRVFPPLFNRYDPGMTFGAHVDNAIRTVTGTPPARSSRHILRLVEKDPTASYSTRTCSPSRARAISASAKRCPSLSCRMM